MKGNENSFQRQDKGTRYIFRDDKTKSGIQFSVAYNRSSEAWLYLATKVEDAEIKLLVDRVATVSLLSNRIFARIKVSREKITTEESHKEIMIAEGLWGSSFEHYLRMEQVPTIGRYS